MNFAESERNYIAAGKVQLLSNGELLRGSFLLVERHRTTGAARSTLTQPRGGRYARERRGINKSTELQFFCCILPRRPCAITSEALASLAHT